VYALAASSVAIESGSASDFGPLVASHSAAQHQQLRGAMDLEAHAVGRLATRAARAALEARAPPGAMLATSELHEMHVAAFAFSDLARVWRERLPLAVPNQRTVLLSSLGLAVEQEGARVICARERAHALADGLVEEEAVASGCERAPGEGESGAAGAAGAARAAGESAGSGDAGAGAGSDAELSFFSALSPLTDARVIVDDALAAYAARTGRGAHTHAEAVAVVADWLGIRSGTDSGGVGAGDGSPARLPPSWERVVSAALTTQLESEHALEALGRMIARDHHDQQFGRMVARDERAGAAVDGQAIADEARAADATAPRRASDAGASGDAAGGEGGGALDGAAEQRAGSQSQTVSALVKRSLSGWQLSDEVRARCSCLRVRACASSCHAC
jgi:hypothetical protein